MTDVYIGLDSGGTGVRGIIARRRAPDDFEVMARVSLERRAKVGANGVDAASLAEVLKEAILTLVQDSGCDGRVTRLGLGATGAGLIGSDIHSRLPEFLAQASGADQVAVTTDIITSYLGALGLRPGAVLAAGTGAIALGLSRPAQWRRVDGWGHLLGDGGGGCWIGRSGLVAAIDAFEGRLGGSEVLLDALRERFGSPESLAADLYSREDRAGVLAGFVPAVVEAADAGDPPSISILSAAGKILANTLLIAAPDDADAALAVVGNLFRVGDSLLDSFHQTLEAAGKRRLLTPAKGDATLGAVVMGANIERLQEMHFGSGLPLTVRSRKS